MLVSFEELANWQGIAGDSLIPRFSIFCLDWTRMINTWLSRVVLWPENTCKIQDSAALTVQTPLCTAYLLRVIVKLSVNMEKRESSETEVAIGSDTNEPHYKPINESVKEPSYATKDEQASTTDDKTEDSSNLQPAQTNASEDGWHYVTGMKLYLVIGMVTLACFIMLLDTSIVATVGQL